MIAGLALELYFAIASPSTAAPPRARLAAQHKPCIVPADLAPDPAIRFKADKTGVPADLPGPRITVPKQIPFYLGQTLAPPAPDYSQLDLGEASVDTETGAVTINGTSFAPRPNDCP